MTELQKNIKGHVFDMFECLSSRQKQINYKKAVSFVHVPNELISEWDGNYIKGKNWYRKIWTTNQWNALSEFDNKFRQLLTELPGDLMDVPEIFENELWNEVMNLSKITLEKLSLDE